MIPEDLPPTVYRVLDANHHRCLEGLRVLEDQVRFEREDAMLSGALKQLRHDVATAVSRELSSRMHAMRDASGDVGRHLAAEDEYHRPDQRSLLIANAARVKQSLRVLEEFGKRIDPQLGRRFEDARYRFYSLEMLLDRPSQRRDRLARASLYLLIDGGDSEQAFERFVAEVLSAQPDLIQLRDKVLGDRELLRRARHLTHAARGTDTLIVINDRPDLAVLADADGVHVGQEELSVADARRIIGPDRLVGVSTHAITQARSAFLEGADYLGVGPTFPSGTKRFESFPGTDYLRQVAAEISLPTFAIGGIDLERVPLVLAAGLRRIAVSGHVTRSSAPAQALQQLRQAIRARAAE